MHFIIDKNNKVNGLHIETWDSQALGKELVEKLNSYSSEKLDIFLKFVLKEKLFLKLRILYMMGNNEVVYFWASPTCFGSESANQLTQATKAFDIKNSKYAMIKLKMKDQNDIVPVLVEDVLASVYQKLNRPSKEIILEMDPKDIKDISVAFNISRNNKHIIRNIVKGMENKGFMEMQLKDVKFIGIKKNHEMEIIEDINNFTKNDYLAWAPTIPNNEKEKKQTEKILNRLNQKETGEKKKGFFSRLFKK